MSSMILWSDMENSPNTSSSMWCTTVSILLVTLCAIFSILANKNCKRKSSKIQWKLERELDARKAWVICCCGVVCENAYKPLFIGVVRGNMYDIWQLLSPPCHVKLLIWMKKGRLIGVKQSNDFTPFSSTAIIVTAPLEFPVPKLNEFVS